MFPRNENRNEGAFGCSPGTKTGTRVRSHVPPEQKKTRVRSPKPPFYETALLSPDLRSYWEVKVLQSLFFKGFGVIFLLVDPLCKHTTVGNACKHSR